MRKAEGKHVHQGLCEWCRMLHATGAQAGCTGYAVGMWERAPGSRLPIARLCSNGARGQHRGLRAELPLTCTRSRHQTHPVRRRSGG